MAGIPPSRSNKDAEFPPSAAASPETAQSAIPAASNVNLNLFMFDSFLKLPVSPIRAKSEPGIDHLGNLPPYRPPPIYVIHIGETHTISPLSCSPGKMCINID